MLFGGIVLDASSGGRPSSSLTDRTAPRGGPNDLKISNPDAITAATMMSAVNCRPVLLRLGSFGPTSSVRLIPFRVSSKAPGENERAGGTDDNE